MSVFPIEKPILHVRMPVRASLRLGPLGDIWHKPAFSAVASVAVPQFALLLAGRPDLAAYAAGGSLCALYGHGLPYAARARTLAWVVAGMLASIAVGLVTASLTDSTVLRVAVAALLAGAHKATCDAARIGPPGHVVLTFVAVSAAFLPQRLADVPAHLALALAAGVVAWLVGMAPALVRPDGPERIAVARALEAAARLLRASSGGQESPQARHAAAAAVNAAWQTLLRTGTAGSRAGLRRLLVRAESAAALPTRHAAEADSFTAWARDLRKGRPLPVPGRSGAPGEDADEEAELSGVAAERPRRHRLLPEVAGRWRVIMMVAAGSALAGWASMALGVGRPYWAVVTAAAVFAANTTLSWNRALQRVVGNLLGVALFTLVVPLTRLGPLALVATVLVMQFLTEATITRNYWLGSVFVAPMSILMTQFAGVQPVGELVADRWLDTCVGAVAGLAACVLLPDRRAARRVHEGLERLERLVAEPPPAGPGQARAARDRLNASLVELREAADTAAGEWWSTALPQERITTAERAGHRKLTELTEPARGAGVWTEERSREATE
ncbi:FUSC family protein [Streptosporangium sandarakinum]|uniref:FUSC family protein n=1 Tax=Streptosporangium sandarakinum TaxID=1260955 RepID=UPI00342B9C29